MFMKSLKIIEFVQKNNTNQEDVVLGAVKYAFVKNRIGGDIIYDPAESVSTEGNSGPYLQYAHARAKSIIRNAGEFKNFDLSQQEFNADELVLARKLSEYPEVVDKATEELMPHHVATYLYELSQIFNRFYEHNRVVGNERQAIRLWLVQEYSERLKNGLNILGITAPDSM
jgi:arginyl-tRNA synthetase